MDSTTGYAVLIIHAEMDEETAEGSSLSHMETFLERGILRNKKTFSAVFDRIFLKVFYVTKLRSYLQIMQYVYGPCSMRESSLKMRLVGNC